MNEKYGGPPGGTATAPPREGPRGERHEPHGGEHGDGPAAQRPGTEPPRWHGDPMERGGSDRHGHGAGLRERKKQATRHALTAAAMRLALEHGFDGLRVEDIAAAAGVSPRTFNNYFPSREAAICAARTDQMRQLAAAVRARPAEEALLDAIINTVSRNPREPNRAEFLLIHCNPSLRAEFLRTVAETEAPLIEAIAERTGTDPRHLLPQVAAAAVFGALRAAMQQWLRSEQPPPYHLLLCDALNQLRALAVTPEGTVPEGAASGSTATATATATGTAGTTAPAEPSPTSSADRAAAAGPDRAAETRPVSPVSGASAAPVNIGDRAA